MSLAVSATLVFLLMLATMLVGMPIAVSMATVGIAGGLAAFGQPFIDSIAPVVWGTLNENLLTCVPLFVLLGELLLRSGIADRMYTALSAWLGGLPGGLSYRCEPPNCVFPGSGAGGLGNSYCIEIFGTPNLGIGVPPPYGTHDLRFSFRFVGPGGSFPIEYPSGFDPDAHVYLNVEPAGNCPEPATTVAGVAVLGVLGALARRRNGRTGA